MNEYDNLKKFWDEAFNGLEAETINEKQITEESFNNLIKDYIKEDDSILDFGCGTGWACFDILYTFKNVYITGVDPSINAIEFNNKCISKEVRDRIEFKAIDGEHLKELNKKYDVVVSFNVIDVIPIEYLDNILKNLKEVSKDNGYLVLGINPEFGNDFLEKNGYEIKNNAIYKDNIYRGTLMDDSSWINKLSEFFDFVEERKISVSEREREYPRRIFILKNK